MVRGKTHNYHKALQNAVTEQRRAQVAANSLSAQWGRSLREPFDGGPPFRAGSLLPVGEAHEPYDPPGHRRSVRPTSVHQLPGDSRTVQTAARTNRRHALQQSTSLPELPGRPASGTAAWEKTRWRTTQEDRTAATRRLPTLTPSIDGTQLSSRALEYKRWDGNQARDDLYHKYSVPKLGTRGQLNPGTRFVHQKRDWIPMAPPAGVHFVLTRIDDGWSWEPRLRR